MKNRLGYRVQHRKLKPIVPVPEQRDVKPYVPPPDTTDEPSIDAEMLTLIRFFEEREGEHGSDTHTS